MNATVLHEVTFGREGNSNVFQTFGWSSPEPGFTWSIGKECGLAFPPMDAPAGFLIELQCVIFRPVDLEVRANDATVASCVIDKPGTFVWRAPPTRRSAPVRLTFRHPNSQRPCDVIDSDDGRSLGLQFRSLRLLRSDPPDMFALAAAGLSPALAPVAEAEGSQSVPTDTFATLASLESVYRDEAAIQRQIYDACERAMAMDVSLREHREHVERNQLGFGDRAAYWLWKLIVDTMPWQFKSLEIGVYKGQITSLLGKLAMQAGKTAESFAVTPLGRFGDKYDSYEDADYLTAIRSIEAWSGIPEERRTTIIAGFSDTDRVKQECRAVAPFDLVYIDGSHDYHVVANDIITYAEMLTVGGLLVIDDASAGQDLPAGLWPGHADVGRAVREILVPMSGFTRVVAVGQLLVWRKTIGGERSPVAGIGLADQVGANQSGANQSGATQGEATQGEATQDGATQDGAKQDRAAQAAGAAWSEISFGLHGNDAPCLISGWADPEAGFRWSAGAASRFAMPAGDADFFILELDCQPCTWPGLPPAQRLVLRVNEQPAGATEITERATIAFAFRRPDDAGDRLQFTLEFPDAALPANQAGVRHVMAIAMIRVRLFPTQTPDVVIPRVSALALPDGVAFETQAAEAMRLSGIAAGDLVSRFEGLGHDCEFGLFQRRCGAEPLALFRFADIRPANLIRGLDADFVGIDDPAFISARLHHADGDFHIHQETYGFRYHTYSFAKDVTAAAVEARHAKLLTLLRRIFFERIANAERIFVIKRNRPISDAEALAVSRALTRLGPATLLYVSLADATHRAGSVEVVGPHLMKGYIDSFWKHGVETFSFRNWLEICLNAHELSKPPANGEAIIQKPGCNGDMPGGGGSGGGVVAGHATAAQGSAPASAGRQGAHRRPPDGDRSTGPGC